MIPAVALRVLWAGLVVWAVARLPIVSALVALPLGTALVIASLPASFRFVIRCLALLGTLLTAVLGAMVFVHFDPTAGGYQFEHLVPWVAAGSIRINYHVGVDGIAAPMLLVASLVGFCATAVSWDIERQTKSYYVLLLAMIGGALGAFASLDLFAFYFFNELALVPTFIMIGVWGHGENRTYAAFKITMYLTAGALVGLAGLVGLYVAAGTNSLDLVEITRQLAEQPLSASAQKYLFPCLLFGFGTLVGLWPLNTWAPLGYSQAPTGTAMMHAGILKKAGLFLLLRAAWPFMPDGVAAWLPVLVVLACGNLLYCGWVAMRQRDFTLLLGNSSLAHMGFAFLGLASLTVAGVTGAVLVMVSHALLAALSFALAGWLRQSAGTVDMDRLGGLLKTMPFVGSILMVCLLAGCGVPGFANFAGELTVMFGAWEGFPGVVVAAAWGGLVIGGVYMLRAIRQVLHGEERPELAGAFDAPGWWRRLPFILLAAGLVYFGIFPRVLSERIRPVAEDIVRAARPPAAPAAPTDAGDSGH